MVTRIEDPDVYIEKAEELYVDGDFEGARKVYDVARRIFPEDGTFSSGLGDMCVALQKYDDALGHYEAAQGLGHEDFHGLVGMAQAEAFMGKCFEDSIRKLIVGYEFGLEFLLQKAETLIEEGEPFVAYSLIEQGVICELSEDGYKRTQGYRTNLEWGIGHILHDLVCRMQLNDDENLELFYIALQLINTAFCELYYEQGCARLFQNPETMIEDYFEKNRGTIMHQRFEGDDEVIFGVDASKYNPELKTGGSPIVICGVDVD